jgi:hypothetical protein
MTRRTMPAPLNDRPSPGPHRAGPVEPDLLASALFLFSEYLRRLEEESALAEEGEEAEPEIETRAVLDLLAGELATDVATTLNLYMRVTALFRLFAASPSLARLALDHEEGGGALREEALVAASRLDLYVQRSGAEGSADYDPREFREALDED